MNKFESLNLSEQLMNAINRLGFSEPTQIQRDTIPLILKGKDVIGESATGSGKTLAFGAGIVEKCSFREGVQAIVLVPTRELAEQVKNELVKLSYKKSISFLAVYGGVSINPQISMLRKADVVIATPGRFLDHLNRGTIDLSKVKMLVLDEADRMVEMGFIEDVEKIIRACPKNRQTLLFSATMHGPAKKIAKKYMVDPIVVHAEKMVDPSKLKQTYYEVPPKLKKVLLVNLLKKENSDLVMVFCNTRSEADVIVEILKANDIKSAPVHGGLTQVKRLRTIDLFHNGKFQVLVCTDVAARGLHIEGVTHIYNFDIPRDPSDYIHRIGRTARAGKNGLVINVVSQRDNDIFSRIKRTHKDYDIQKEERPDLNPINKIKNEEGSFDRRGDFRKRKGSWGNKGGNRKGFSGKRREGFGKREGGDRKEFSGKREGPWKREGGDRKEFSGKREGPWKREGGDRKEFSGKREGPWKREGGDRKSFSGKREGPWKRDNFGSKKGSFGDKKDFSEKKEGFGDKKSFWKDGSRKNNFSKGSRFKSKRYAKRSFN